MLDRIEYPELGDEVRGAGLPHVAELPHHHARHPGGVGNLPASQPEELLQVCPLHSALGAQVDWTNVWEKNRVLVKLQKFNNIFIY